MARHISKRSCLILCMSNKVTNNLFHHPHPFLLDQIYLLLPLVITILIQPIIYRQPNVINAIDFCLQIKYKQFTRLMQNIGTFCTAEEGRGRWLPSYSIRLTRKHFFLLGPYQISLFSMQPARTFSLTSLSVPNTAKY